MKSLIQAITQQEDLNFLLTNRVPRQALTHFMGWFSQIESPVLTRAAIAVWRLFSDLDLSESRQSHFRSLMECFTRELRPGARPIDPDPTVLSSPCDAIVGACGPVRGTAVFQAKGFPYTLAELFGPTQDTTPFHDGEFITLRLTSSMYHRFHAPFEGQMEHVTYLSGDTWNVNPIALKRVERLFCRNERAVLRLRLHDGQPLLIVPVAAILVASIRLHCLDVLMHLRWRGPRDTPCQAAVRRGQEMGWFEHGSTLVLLLPDGMAPVVQPGQRLRMGQALVRRAPVTPVS